MSGQQPNFRVWPAYGNVVNLMAEQQSDRLESWKEIAAYLRRGERTARRWEMTEALPVHRQLHAQKGTVWSTRAEIDELLSVPTKEGCRGRRNRVLGWALVASACCVLLVIVAVRLRSKPIVLGQPGAADDLPRC
jgi:hypothetical protein